jgi:hypothetical protein
MDAAQVIAIIIYDFINAQGQMPFVINEAKRV